MPLPSRLVAAPRIARDAGRQRGLFEAQSPSIEEQVIGCPIVGHEEIDEIVSVDVGSHHAEPAPSGIGETGRASDLDESATRVPEDMVGCWFDFAGVAVKVSPLVIPAKPRMGGIPEHVVAYVEIETAVVIEIGECRRCGVVAHAGQPGRLSDVLKSPPLPIA